MRRIIHFFLIFLLFGSLIQGVLALSKNEQNLILRMHNEVRESLGIGALVWDAKIAIEAQKWADTLAKNNTFRHSDTKSRSGRGENIYMMSSNDKWFDSDGSDAMMTWLDEVTAYDYASNNCLSGHMCGHYTQIIWKNTKKIGCGKSKKRKNAITKIYWVCQYDPPGNFIGQKPY